MSPDPLTMASVAGQAAGGILQIGASIIEGAQAKKAERKAGARPDYEINQNIKDDLAIAENKAGQGLSDGALNTYQQENERGVSASLDAISKNGGNANNIAGLYGRFEAGSNHLALMDEQMRAANVQALIVQKERMAEEQDKQWQLNVMDPWKDEMAKAAIKRQQAAQNLSNGVNSIIGAGANVATASMYKDKVYPDTPRRPRVVDPVADMAIRPQTQVPAVAGSAAQIASKWPGLTVGYRNTFSIDGITPGTYNDF